MFDKNYLFKALRSGAKSFPNLARRMSVPRDKNRDFSKFLNDLTIAGEIFQTSDRKYFRPEFIKEVTGEIRLNPRGFGFVDIEDEESVFIGPNSVNTAMDLDTVVVKVFKDPIKEGSLQGLVIEVTKRYKADFVAVIKKFGDKLGLIPLDQKIKGRFRFNGDTSKLKEGYEVLVKIVSYGKTNSVELIRILGHKDDIAMDILATIIDANVPYEFDPLTIKEAQEVPENISKEPTEGRTDVRDRMIVTIDGDDTKDFDDAIEVRKLDNGNYLLGVHIADVTYYVKEGSALDDEAKERGTSIYLADRVIPMLPEALSNGICSLNPHEDRFVLSADIEINKQGKTVDYKLYPGIINSKHRLTYKEVNNYYRGLKKFEDKEVEKMLDTAKELASIIRAYKNQEGYIDFEIEEAKIIIDDKGKTSDVVVRERGESEMLIEDFMVRANETVAFNAFSKEYPFIYRVHDKPDADRLVNLQNVLNALELKINVPLSAEPKVFAETVAKIKEARFDDFMKIMMLRTMSKAVYSETNIGHFGLASENYTHFTSPIRRYPDLMVHRMIREYFFEKKANRKSHFAEILPAISDHSSKTEQKAVELERKVADMKKAEFYESFIGKEFKGQIVSMLKFGFFVEFPNKVDGLVHVSNMYDGKYEIVGNGYKLSNGKRTFTVGQEVSVVVIGTSKSEGKIDLVLSDQYEEYKKYQANVDNNRKFNKRR